jgi:endoglucanase
VVDTANNGISHSEGQGYAMLMAEWANERETFGRLLNWTRSNLSRRGAESTARMGTGGA